jgi:Flp pilus assembly CpaF family ATPase
MVSYLKKQNNSMSYEMAALLWQAIQFEMNIIIAGGTASGKTSALNGLLALVQPFQRIVTIEDTRELMLPSFQWNWVPLVTRQPNPEGAGEVTMLDLVVNSLRMRPDRIVMGEIRRKKEAEVLFEAIHTGHSVYATIHADTGSQVIKRLIEPPNGKHQLQHYTFLTLYKYPTGFPVDHLEYFLGKLCRVEVREWHYRPKKLLPPTPYDQVPASGAS